MTHDYLRALYQHLPEHAWFYIWTLGATDKATHWFPAETLDSSLAKAAALANDTTHANVYYPIGYYAERLSSNARGTEQEIAGIVGYVADIDFRGDGHPKAPADEAAALDLIDAFPLRPTACIHSGHGLQAAWLFKEPWHFDSPEERQLAKALSANWWNTLAAIASRRSYELDAVHDLTRVMRLPGTMNVKRRPVPVELRWLEEETRYNPPMDFEPHITPLPQTLRLEPLPTVDPKADFPTAKFDLLCANLPEFRLTYDHQRKLPRDNSCSGYDMALANMAVAAGWTDDEVSALIQDHRRKHGQDKPQKVNDVKYLARTIQAARRSANEHRARQEAEQVLLEGTDEATPQQIIAGVAARLDIPLTHVQIVTGDPSILRLWIGGKCAEVPVTSLDSPVTTYKAVLNAARFYPRPIEKKEVPGWRDMVNNLLRIAEEVEAGDDATAEGEFRAILDAFLEARPPLDVPEGELVQITGNPFRRSGYVWFRILDFLQYARLHDRGLNRRQVAQKLKTLGCTQKVHKCSRGGIESDSRGKSVRFYGWPEVEVDQGDEV